MAKKNSEENRNYLEDMSKLIAEMDNLKLEREICNVSCPPFGCPLGPCPGICCDANNNCNPCCISKTPKNSKRKYFQSSRLSCKLLPPNTSYDASTSTWSCPIENSQTCSLQPNQIHQSVFDPHLNSTIDIQESTQLAPNFYNYPQRKPFGTCFSKNYLQQWPVSYSKPYQASANNQQNYPQPSSSLYLVTVPLRETTDNKKKLTKTLKKTE